MGETLAAQLAALSDEIQAAAIPDVCKRSVAWCLGQLPILYANFRQTHESRYADEITRLVEGSLTALVTDEPNAPEARQLGAGIIDRLQRLHEEFGLPGLHLRPSLDQTFHNWQATRLKTTKRRHKTEQDKPKPMKVSPPQLEGNLPSMAETISRMKTVHTREKELRSLLTTSAGRAELEELASRYQSTSGKARPGGTSTITYIVVHEREHGLISN